jgi:long-chain acyl-CoA synthetase
MATEAVPAARPDERECGRRTIAALWRDATSKSRTNAAYLVETSTGWEEVSWAEAARRVNDLANGLLALGIRRRDRVSILASTRLEWALADFALGSIGAISAAIYANSAAGDCAYIIEHSESVAVLVEDEEQRAKVEQVRAQLPGLRHVIAFAELVELEARGREYAAEHPGALEEASAAIDEDDVFTYIYTSGTTGPPKGCMIRHRNYFEMVTVVDRMNSFVLPSDLMLLYLPLAHNYGRLLHLSSAYVGYTIAFCPDPLRVGEVLPEVRPTLLPSVPRVFEKVHTAVLAGFEAQTGVKRRLIDWSLGVGREVSVLQQAGKPVPPLLAARHRIADRLVFAKVKDRLGGRLRVANSGGAPLAREIAQFFHAIGLLILEGYGLTECTTAATVNRPERFRFGTVGPALPEVELRIADDGEILIRSPTIFAGYYKEPEATREVLDPDGWLRSGDIGHLDDDGFLTITDRKKDIIVTAGGKNVSPQNLENALKSAGLVSQALVIGDRRPYISALITIDPQAAAGRSPEELERAVQTVVEGVNDDRSRYEQIKRFAILPRDFSAEEGEVTPTLKLKRRVCEQHFAAEIDQLYSSSEPSSADPA